MKESSQNSVILSLFCVFARSEATKQSRFYKEAGLNPAFKNTGQERNLVYY